MTTVTTDATLTSTVAWPSDIRERAIKLYIEHGAAHASRELGIPSGTIKSWAHRQNAQPLHHAKNTQATAAAVARRKRSAEERRTRLVELLGEIAELGAEKELELLAGDPALRDVVGARTRAIHDMQLLAGDVTGRTEVLNRSEVDSALAELTAEMRANVGNSG